MSRRHAVRIGLIMMWLMLTLTAASIPASAQISPGPLSQAHSSLDGAINCTTCHKLGGEAQFKCLDCHKEIAARLAMGAGYHGKFLGRTTSSQGCAKCHSEHNGRAFMLIRWEPSLEKFDHSKTGYVLQGKHATAACNKCHAPQHVSADIRPLIQFKDLKRTYLGMSESCVMCHEDAHRGQLGANCQQCHSFNDWKTSGKFDHAKTKFPLTGAHAQVTCQKCHVPTGAEGMLKLTGLEFASCTNCHTDPHHGSFQARCESCHTTMSWKAVPQSALAARFDHSKTKYPLVGKHLEVGCEQCHFKGEFKRPIVFDKCSNCHRPDPHSGQFVERADKGECSGCHTVEGFKPAKFGLAEHKLTRYPLEAKHSEVDCAKCHIPAGKATLYKIKFGQCMDCHKDFHQGQFAAAPFLSKCESCHTIHGFDPSTYTIEAHNKTRFRLVGAHLATACNDCHKPATNNRITNTILFRFDDLTCTGCHQDPHRGQFKVRMAKLGTSGSLGCEVCHNSTSWHDLSKFDHSKTDFVLTGTHRAVACIECHKPPSMGVKLVDADFRVAPKTCQGCHDDIHGGQFANKAHVTECSSCHRTGRWKPSEFDHNTRTSFALQGVHKDVRCARCHARMVDMDGKKVLLYKPTPKECSACHGPEVIPGKSKQTKTS